MSLESRKYHFIQELFSIDKESIIDTLKHVLQREKEEFAEVPSEHKEELDNRLESYKNNPDDILNWKDIKNDW